MSQTQTPQLDPQIVTLAKSIRQVESGGNFQAKGASGEYGAYQWEPDTWAANSKAAGIDVPLEQATSAQQNEVAYKTLASWKSQHPDWNIGNFASAWNAGEGAPNAYLDNNTGTNSKGVSYNTPAYAKKVAETYQQFKGQSQGQIQASQDQQGGVSSLATEAGAPGSFLGDVGNTLSSAYQGVGKAVQQGFGGQINPASAVLQGAGAVASGVGGLINDVATHLPVVGGAVQGAENMLGQGIGAAAQTAPGQAVVGAVNQFSQAHPELAGDIGAAGNIAGLASSLIGGGEAGIAVKEGLESAAAKGLLGDTIKAASDRAAFNEALDVVSPKATAGVLKKGIKSGRGVLQGGVESIAPDQQTINAAKAAAGIVKKGNTAVENANAVRGAISDTATGLKKELGSMEITPIVSQEELLQLRTQAMQEIGANPTMVGNAEESAKRIFTKFQSLLPQTSDVTALDVLNARQKLDSWIQSLKGSNIFDPATENAMSIALRSIRQGANKLIADKAPGVAVKEALAKQSSLYDALDNIAAKGTKEIGTTRLGRFATRHPVLKTVSKGLVRGALIGTGMKAAADLIP